MVEAAVALPLVILAVITMIYVLLNMFCAVRSDVRLHIAVGESAGISSGTWCSYRNHPRDISMSGSRCMGGGLPPDALFGIRDKIKEYYCSPANHDDRGMSIPEKIPEDVRLYEKGWPGLYLHQAVLQAKNAGTDKLAKAAETAVILKEWGATQEMVIAAILHSSLYGRPEEIAGICDFYSDSVTSILSGLHFDQGRTWHQKMAEDYICAKESSMKCRAIIMAELITELRELEKEFLDNDRLSSENDEEKLSHEEYLSCLIDAFDDLQDDELWKDDYWIMGQAQTSSGGAQHRTEDFCQDLINECGEGKNFSRSQADYSGTLVGHRREISCGQGERRVWPTDC